MTDTVSIFKAEEVFRSEVKQARERGFELQIGVGQKGVRARLVPISMKTLDACLAIGAGSFEARCAVPKGSDGLDVLRETIQAVLDHQAAALA